MSDRGRVPESGLSPYVHALEDELARAKESAIGFMAERDALEASLGRHKTELDYQIRERAKQAVRFNDVLFERDRLREGNKQFSKNETIFIREEARRTRERDEARAENATLREERDRYFREVTRLRETAIDETKLSRVTLVNETGIAYERYGVDVALSVQDQGRTLKVFVHDALRETS